MTRRLAVTACLLALGGCGRPAEPRVVIYVSMDEHVARPVLAAFERDHGVRVDALFDSEAAKTTGLAARLRQEAAAPQADLFWSSEQAQSGSLLREGVLSDAPGHWRPCLQRTRVLAWRRNGQAAPAPISWWALPEWARTRRVGMADPRFGTTGVQLGAMLADAEGRGEPDAFLDWCRGMHAAGVVVLSSGNAGVVRAILAGEIDAGLTDSDDVAAAVRDGAPLDSQPLWLSPSGGGPVVMSGVAAVVAGAPHADLALRLAQYLGSRDVQEALSLAAPGFEPLLPEPADPAVSPRRHERTSERAAEAIRIFLEAGAARDAVPRG